MPRMSKPRTPAHSQAAAAPNSGTSKPAPAPDPALPVAARERRKGRLKVPPAGRAVVQTAVHNAAPSKVAKGKPRARLSALDAAARVLEGLKGAAAKEGIGAGELVDRMQRTGLWASAGGKTPSATLYAAMIREIAAKKGGSRFARVAPGRFACGAASRTRRGGRAK